MIECDPTSPAPIPVWLVAVRAVHLGACLLLFGLPAFDRLFAREGMWPADTWPRAAWPSSTRWLLRLALPVALLSGAAWLVLVAADMGDCTPAQAVRQDALRLVWSQTHFGRLWQLRSALWLATTLLLLPALLLAPLSRLRSALTLAALIPAGGLLGSLAWAGHGLNGAGPAAPAHLPADVLHLLVTGVWPTGLLPLGLLLLRMRRGAAPDDPDRWPAVSRLTRGFSAVSLAAVLVLAATGVVNSWFLVGSLPALTGTAYGRLLLGKITVFAGMLGLGAVNLLILKPRLSAAGGAGAAQAATIARHLQYNVFLESALGMLVILVVALLGVLPPAAG